jgi:hypothetical protein
MNKVPRNVIEASGNKNATHSPAKKAMLCVVNIYIVSYYIPGTVAD